jgi:hypothetical protein
MKFSGASLKSGTTRNGIVYPLPPLAPHTDVTAFGLLATPITSQGWKPLRPLCPVEKAGKHGKTIVSDIGDRYPEHVGQYLNPSVSEWIMGFPIGWTDINNLEML